MNASRKPTRLIRIAEVINRVGLKKTAIYARIAAGTFPKPAHDGGVALWVEAEIENYLERLIAARDQGER